MRYILIRYAVFAYLAMGIFMSVMWKDLTAKNKSFWYVAWLFSPISFVILFLYSCGLMLATLFDRGNDDPKP